MISGGNYFYFRQTNQYEKMPKSQELGSSFEKITEEFFLFLFQRINIQVNNNWIQKSGTQFGFDVGFEIALPHNDIFKRGIFIECKNYEKSKLKKGDLHEKLIEFDTSTYEKLNSIFIFLSPRVNITKVKQDSNPKLLEDYFNSTKEFKTIILTPQNQIKRILSLHQEIFEKVYGEAPKGCNDQEQKEILTYFDTLFCSKGEIPNFKNIEQKKNFLEEASVLDFTTSYIHRNVTSNEFYLYNKNYTLLDAVKEQNIILLNGEPGVGKSTELKHLANHFSENIKTLRVTPIFVNLADIKAFKEIEDLLPANWDQNDYIILLLDALDEFIFKKELENAILVFLQKKEVNIKIVISCRTYAYNDQLSNLNPKKYYLTEFDALTSYSFLEKNYNFNKKNFNKINKSIFKEILKDPFLLNQLGLYFKTTQQIPQNTTEVFSFIKYDISELDLNLYKTIALVFELTQKSSLSLVQLKSLFGIIHNKILRLTLIQKSFDGFNCKFRHKNYQEYFAALAISGKSFENILSFIKVENTSRIHPSLFNTITLLINMLEEDTETKEKLITWLCENDPELLFKADYNRISSEIRISVFQKYFQDQCIDKTFWIKNNGNLSVQEIAEFGDCQENYTYLKDIINDKKQQYRISISALHLLSYFKIVPSDHEDFLLSKLKEEDIALNIKSEVIKCIEIQNLHKDEKYLNSIFEIFKDETNNEINTRLLSLLENSTDLDTRFDYILAEFLRIHKIIPRNDQDKVHRGNEYKIKGLIFQLKSSDNFLNIVQYYFNKELDLYYDSDLAKRIADKCIEFSTTEKDFINRLLSQLNGKVRFNAHNDLLKNIIIRSNSLVIAIQHLLLHYPFKDSRSFIAYLVDESTIGLIIQHILKDKVSNEEIENLRNNIGNNNKKELAEKFHNKMVANGIEFKKPVFTQNDFDQRQLEYTQRAKYNLNILFDKETLFQEIEGVFTTNKLVKMSYEVIAKIEMKWFEKHHYTFRSKTSISIIKDLVHDEELSARDVKKRLKEDELILFKTIKSLITSYESTNLNFTLSEHQKEKIKAWAKKASQEINFNKINSINASGSFSLLQDYDKLKTVLYFLNKYEINLSKDFLLNSLSFFDIDNTNDEDSNFEKLYDKISDKELFDLKVIENLRSKGMIHSVLVKHMDYALKNNLKTVFPIIREHLINDNSGFIEDKRLEEYVRITGDVEMLKECCKDINSRICWSAIDILLKKHIEEAFCKAKAIECLDKLDSDKSSHYYSDAFKVLFSLNDIKAITYFLASLDKKIHPSISEQSFSNYSAINENDYSILKVLFTAIYNKNSSHKSKAFFYRYVINLSKEDGYIKVQDILKEIKIDIEDTDMDLNKSNLFEINHLIERSENSYIESKSVPYAFDKALEETEKILGY